MKINKITSVCLISLIILSFSNFAFAEENNTTEENTGGVRALTLQEQQNQVSDQLATASSQLEYVQGELSEKMVDIQNLQDKMVKYQSEYDEINSQYQNLQADVDNVKNELNDIQTEYNKKDKVLRERLVELYKQGSTTYIDVLLGSNDVIEFVSNYFMISEIAEYDNKTLKEINKQKKKIEKKNNELAEKKEKLKIAKNNAEKQNVILTNTKTILESEKSSLDSSEQILLAQIDSYKKQQEEINSLITQSIIASTYELQYSGGIMCWPTIATNYITSPFGSRMHPIQGIVKNHDGIDIGGHTNDPVYAAQDGVIIYYSWMSGYGNTVMIDHGTNDEGVKIVTLYGHGDSFIDELTVGSEVKKGQLILNMGSTGNSTGSHVHFEVRENGVAVDPKKYLSSETN